MLVFGKKEFWKAAEMSEKEKKANFRNSNDYIDLADDKDMVMEQILENVNSTPLGQVLKRISSLPEVRQEKVLNIRTEITKDNYGVNDRLDTAIDRVLEELVS
jgi:hypothetical protein